jgi:peptide methionine sulfoxide reductase msrA/msrB
MDKTSSLPEIILAVVQEKGTEKPFSGEYDKFGEEGTYLCRRCGLALFRSTSKFHSGCGWPSFDEEVVGAVKREVDEDGRRVEILCSRCQAHLGHVFYGEQYTASDTRHCVNSLSLDFVPEMKVLDTEEAIFAAGCFWGVEHFIKQLPGVLRTQVGYSGGNKSHPTYQEICSGTTGHYEVIRVLYDPSKLDYQRLVQFFFEIHNFSQNNGQGPDIGQQYLSVIFYYDAIQKQIAEQTITTLKALGHPVSTTLLPVKTFWPAEDYHQDYYSKQHKEPYCHRYLKIF